MIASRYTIQFGHNFTFGFIQFQYVIQNLEGNKWYDVKICAETKSLSENQDPKVGRFSAERSIFLGENCSGGGPALGVAGSSVSEDRGAGGGDSDGDFGELSAEMIAGAVCAVLFLLFAVIGFVVWRYYYSLYNQTFFIVILRKGSCNLYLYHGPLFFNTVFFSELHRI